MAEVEALGLATLPWPGLLIGPAGGRGGGMAGTDGETWGQGLGPSVAWTGLLMGNGVVVWCVEGSVPVAC